MCVCVYSIAMTVFYTDEISDGDNLTVTCKLLRRWRGSLYKLVWSNLVIYVILYFALSLTYRIGLTEQQKRIFEQLVDYCEKAKHNIPISFLLGFFVSGIVGRWFLIFPCIPWLNRMALEIATSVNAKDELLSRKIRITMIRYVNLAWILLLRLMSDQTSKRFSVREVLSNSVRKRQFYHPWSISTENESVKVPKLKSNSGLVPPALDHSPCPSPGSLPTPSAMNEGFAHFTAFKAVDDYLLVESLKAFNNDQRVQRTFGRIITDDEIDTFQSIASEWYARTKTRYTPEYWIPIQWAQRLTVKALQNGYITEPRRAYQLIHHLNRFRGQLQYLQIFSSMMVPLAYAQVVTIALYSYVTCQLFASQFVERRNGVLHSGIDLYVPVFDILSFLFIMGWYKVALCVINPFGDDDEDFCIGDILDYNLDVSYRSVYMDPHTFPRPINTLLSNDDDEAQQSMDQFHSFLDTINPDLWSDMQDQNDGVSTPTMSRCARLRRTCPRICQSPQTNSRF